MIDLAYWDLQRCDGELLWSGASISGLVSKYGSPLYVINKTMIERAYSRFVQAMSSGSLEFDIFYSFKTNPVPAYLKRLIHLGAGAEVVSEFELWLAKSLGLGGEKIIVNGSVKSDRYLAEAVRTRPAMINVETSDELTRLENISRELGIRANVGIRVNPKLKTSWRDFTLSTGASTSHIGVLPGDQEWNNILKIIKTSDFLNFVGLHFHIGSGIKASKPYMRALDNVVLAMEELVNLDIHPRVLNMGGGFNIRTLKEINIYEGIRLLGLGRSPTAPTIKDQTRLLKEIIKYFSDKLHLFSERHGIMLPRLFVEPGRALSATSQALLLTVHQIKKRGKNKTFAICDAGALSISPMLFSEYHTILAAKAGNEQMEVEYDIVGNLPTPLDFVALKKKLPALSAGDVIVIMDVGAYFTSLGNNFSGPRPSIVLIDDREETLVRRKESFQDLVARDMNFTQH